MSKQTQENPMEFLFRISNLMGMWPKPSAPKYQMFLYGLVSLAVILIMFTQAVCGVTYIVLEPDLPVAEMVNASTTPLGLCVGILSGMNLLFRQSSLLNLFERTVKDFPNHPQDLKQKWFQRTRAISLTFLTLWPAWIFFYDMRPVIEIHMGEETNKTYLLEDYLPCRNWYPFNASMHPMFELTYLYQTTGAFISITLCGVLCAILISLTIFSMQQFDILADSLRSIKSLSNSSKDVNEQTSPKEENMNKHKVMKERLEECIRHHITILRFVEDFNSFVSNWILIFLFDLSLILTLVAYVASQGMGMNYNSSTMFTYVLISASYMLIIGKAGSEIASKSTMIAEAAYDCGWEDAEISFQKSVCIIILRSHRPAVLTVGKFYVVNQEIILSLLNMAFSYYMVLREVADVE